jgi:HD-GYP domain-containing protein (c-di-GMP phosphodiesterase class II)
MNEVTNIISMCDPITRDHQNRVSILAVWIGQVMALSPTQIENIRIVGQIHDVGKVSLPAEFLVKRTDLNPSERIAVMGHPQVGFDLLADSGLSDIVRQSVLQHHERIDGSGYPNQLHGHQIRAEAKVVSVADVVDAMTSHRPYNATLGIVDALNEITKNKGKYYDPPVVDACLRIFSMGSRPIDVDTALVSFLNTQPMCC